MVYQQMQWTESKMGELIYGKDWSKSPLGAIETWPQSLKAILHMCLTSESSSAICWGRGFTFLYNEAWKNLFEEDPASLGLPARKVFESRWENLEPYFEEVLSSGEVKETEQTFTLSDKDEQKVNLSFSPIYGDSGLVEGVFTIAKISKSHKKKKNPLFYNEQELHDFFDEAPIGIHWLAADGTVLNVNQTELDMLGYSRKEFVGHNITEFCVNEESITEALQTLKEGEEIHNYEAQMIHKDGSTLEISLSSNVYRENGNFVPLFYPGYYRPKALATQAARNGKSLSHPCK